MKDLATIAEFFNTLFRGAGSAVAWVRSLFRSRANQKVVDTAQESGDTSDIEKDLNK